MKEGDDKYYHEAEIIWAPHATILGDPDAQIYLSVINLPLENYYDINQTDKIVAQLFALSTRRPDWLAASSVINVPPELEAASGESIVDNPEYINNRPVAGITYLDGGNWDTDPAIDWKFSINGGDWDALKQLLNTYATHAEMPAAPQTTDTISDYVIVTADETRGGGQTVYRVAGTQTKRWEFYEDMSDITCAGTRQNVIHSIYAGTKAAMPPKAESTVHSLKFATDTGELFIDPYGDLPIAGNTYETGGNMLVSAPASRGTYDFQAVLGVIPSPYDAEQMTGFDLKYGQYVNGTIEARDRAIQSDTDGRLSFRMDNGVIKANVQIKDVTDLLTGIQECTDDTFNENLEEAIEAAIGGGSITEGVETCMETELPEADSKVTVALNTELVYTDPGTKGTLIDNIIQSIATEISQPASAVYAQIKTAVIASLTTTDFDAALSSKIASLITSEQGIQESMNTVMRNAGFQKTSREIN
jgi:hypothetical protein